MVKKGSNIFDYYRGPEVTDSKVERVKTLENNATKALINTLENCSDKLTRELFEETLGIQLEGELSYFLQTEPKTLRSRVPNENLDIKEAYVIGISEKEKRKTNDSNKTNPGEDSTPDALITDNEKLIAIEAKTGTNELEEKQLKKHLNNCKSEFSLNKFKIRNPISWSETSEVMDDFKDCKQKKNDLEKFLINDFIEFLEVNRMTPFKNFDEDLLTAEDRNRVLKGQLFDLAERLRKDLEKEYGLTHTSSTDGRPKNTWDYLSCWEIYDEEDGIRDLPHITLSLQNSKFEIKIHVGGKVGEGEHITYLYNLEEQKIEKLATRLKEIFKDGSSMGKIENEDLLPSWYKKGYRPIRLSLHGRRGGPTQFVGLKSNWRLKRELGIVFKNDLKRIEDFLQGVFKGTNDGKRHHFQIILEYPYSSPGNKDATNILTGEVGRDFYEEAREAVEKLCPIFNDINDKSL